MTTTPTAAVPHIVAKLARLPLSDVTPAAELRRDLGIDSLAHLELVVQLERLAGTRIDDEQAFALTTVQDCLDLVAGGSGAS